MTLALAQLQEDHLQTELLAIWRRLLCLDALTIDDDFFESGGDSLLAADMILETERRLGISFPESLLFEVSTIRKIAETFARSPQVQGKTVYRVGDATGASPLLFFHGDWTHGGFYLKQFARALGPDQPLAAVAPHGMRGDRIPGSLEEMAADRLPQILEFQPQGPYRLGGHCVGGMVALETARLLKGRGHKVETVAMIDPFWIVEGQPQRRPDGHEGGQDRWQDLPDMTATAESLERYGQALRGYSPGPLNVPLLVFSCAFDGRPWRQVSSDLTLLELPYGHFDLVTFRAGTFAAHLRDRLKPRRWRGAHLLPAIAWAMPGRLRRAAKPASRHA